MMIMALSIIIDDQLREKISSMKYFPQGVHPLKVCSWKLQILSMIGWLVVVKDNPDDPMKSIFIVLLVLDLN